ncbi:MAG: guanylate kinase [Polynucleobacter victoriensis]|uniref:Guanylate kinase n=1 Tax=Polynucleobacter victoriensis TaxID=2049319 RepID=A0A212U323_9BURK|nr:guanylate kinase [Polynucleobacter victoriensis]SNC72524.1 guanylate kinase [Polynucleobacter victoriensis]
MAYTGSMLMVVAPSGAGKSSLVNALLEKDPDIGLSVSFTTRAPRPGEVNGREYNFLTEQEFLKRKDAGDFLEWANVHGNYYGTSKSWIESQMKNGKDVILEIDWQGARQVQQLIPQAIWIFILPPSIQTLEDRLRKRAQDDEATIQKRVAAAKDELAHVAEANYLVVNDNFEQALSDLNQVVLASRLRTGPQLARQHQLAKELGAIGGAN